MNKIQNLLFEEKYRPTNIDAICLPERLKLAFQNIINSRDIPNLLLYGYTGTGKTTCAKILVDETDSEYLFINGSENRGIDILRTLIKDFVSTVSFNNQYKVVIIDEADNLSTQTLAAMRGFIEEHTKNARFIFTAETIEKFPKAILSRLKDIEFRFSLSENREIMNQFFKRLIEILKNENVEIDKTVLIILKEFLKMNFPGLRKCIVDLQKYLILNNNVIDEGLLKPQSSKIFDKLCNLLKNRKYKDIRQLIKNEIGEDVQNYFKMLYNEIEIIFRDESISDSVIVIGEYMYRDSISRSKEINFAACCMQLMKLGFK